jgi:hypothetical protein
MTWYLQYSLLSINIKFNFFLLWWTFHGSQRLNWKCSSRHFSLFSVMKSIMFLLCPNNFNTFRLNLTCNIKTDHKNHFFSVELQLEAGLGCLLLSSLHHTQLDIQTWKDALNEWTCCHRGHYLHNTQQTEETNIHVFNRSLTFDSSNQTATDLCFRLHGH